MLELFGWSSNGDGNRFGLGHKAVYGDMFVQLNSENIDTNSVADFAYSREATFLISRKSVEKLPSLISEEPDYRGLVSFYKKKGDWQYFKHNAQGDLEEVDGGAPSISFATRHPIKDWDAIKDTMPDLLKLESVGSKNKPGRCLYTDLKKSADG